MTQIKSYRVSILVLLILIAISATTSAYAQTFYVLYNFGSHAGDPANPSGIVAQGRDGNLYTTSPYGGAYRYGCGEGCGAVFEVSPSGQLRVLYSFCSQANCADGSLPYGGLTLGTDGNFYGTTTYGGLAGCEGVGCGTIFKIAPNGSLTVLYSFTGGADGYHPAPPPIQGTDGNFYGTAFSGGSGSGCGTVYRMTTSGAFTTLFQFGGGNGCHPVAPLVLGTDGDFYGTTGFGGDRGGDGVIFKIAPKVGFTVLYAFDGVHGSRPYAPLVQGSDGNFYGTTVAGGGWSGGVVFQITPTGTLTVLHDFDPTDGSNTYAGLVQATDGNFYGAAQYGGSSFCFDYGCGTLFQVTPAGSYSVLYNFDDITGSWPTAAPLQHTNGLLYGDTPYGGTGVSCSGNSCWGVFYSLDASLPAFVTLLPYSGKVGRAIQILGQGFTSASTVSFNGTPATVRVDSATFLRALVPSGATTGFVTVTTSSGTLTSNRQFVVTP
jgi:uncharacterized repeat protein (TIGR03803 family)